MQSAFVERKSCKVRGATYIMLPMLSE